MDTEVIIIGAGPTGLMAACQLGRFGVRFIIADVKSGPTLESRAMLVTARSMEIYQQMGISDAVIQGGKAVDKFSILIHGNKEVSIPIGKAGAGLTDFPNIQVFEQSKNEELLCESLNNQGHEVLWDTEFISLEQDTNAVTVQLHKHSTTKETIRIQAKYLIACDGARSQIRHTLKRKFEGGTYENKFFVADTNIKWNRPDGGVLASLSKQSFCAFFPMYGNNSYRVLGTMPKSYLNNESIGFKDLEAVIQSTIEVPLQFEKVNWFSVYQLHYRCVDKFRTGRCFLAGDAAHIHSPAGGQGMNTGLQDAYNLSWKLAMVLQNTAGNRLLNSYHSERYPFAKWLLKFTDRVFAVMTSSNVIAGWCRIHFAPLILSQILNRSRAQQKLFKIVSQIWYSYHSSPLSMQLSKQSLKFKAGDRFPYVETLLDGELKSCNHLLSAAKFHLIIIGGNETGNEKNLIPQKLESWIILRYLPLSKEWQLQGVKTKLFMLVRPDCYIALLSDNLTKNTLLNYFDQLN